MIEINVRNFLGEFNASKFVVYGCLLIFSILLAAALDKLVTVSFVVLFLPLWLGEACVFAGFITGLVSFLANPPSRTDIPSRGDFFAMCFQTLEHVLLLMFQLLVYIKLEHYLSGEHQKELNWLLVFSPLFVQSFMAMVVAIWCIRHEKPFEFEMFFAVNIIQFVFLAFKLDSGINWSWALVLVPTWVFFSLFLLCSIYSLTIALFLNRHLYAHQHHTQAGRRPRLCASMCQVLLSVPILLHLLLLTGKLDALESRSPHSAAAANAPFLVVGLPLNISLLIQLLLSFGSRSGNIWWFGIRQPFCNFLFELFPCFQHYANISCKFGGREEEQRPQRPPSSSGQRSARRSRMMRQSSYYQHSQPSAGNSSVRVYGIEEATSSWMVAEMEEERIIVNEDGGVGGGSSSCEIERPELAGSSKQQRKQQQRERRKDKEEKMIAFFKVRGSIESPD